MDPSVVPSRQTATQYHDLGGNYFDERNRDAVKRRAVHRLEKLGFKVELMPIAAPAGQLIHFQGGQDGAFDRHTLLQ